MHAGAPVLCASSLLGAEVLGCPDGRPLSLPTASPAAPGMSALLSPQEENRLLQQELSRVEDLLAQSRAERDALAIKYNAISERVSRCLGSPFWPLLGSFLGFMACLPVSPPLCSKGSCLSSLLSSEEKGPAWQSAFAGHFCRENASPPPEPRLARACHLSEWGGGSQALPAPGSHWEDSE